MPQWKCFDGEIFVTNSAILYIPLVLPTAEERTTSGLQATITWILTRSYSPGAQHTPKHFSILQFYWCQVEWLYPTYKFQDWMLVENWQWKYLVAFLVLPKHYILLTVMVEHLHSGELNHWSSAKIGFVCSSPPVDDLCSPCSQALWEHGNQG